MKNVLVLGASSAIAQALCRKLALSGAAFQLLGRNGRHLQIVAEDLLARGAKSAAVAVVEEGSYADLEAAISAHGKGIDLFVAAQGWLPLQEDCEKDPRLLAEAFRVNGIEVMQAALLMAAHFERQGRGTCVILGSVAGDRGRCGNYVYGAAKASLETFCEGLRQRLEPSCRVLLVKPGPVDTPMTARFRKGLLFSTPETVAGDILSAIGGRRAVLYTPFYWRWIMLLIRFLPRSIVKRLKA